jgi:Rrf2 family protein
VNRKIVKLSQTRRYAIAATLELARCESGKAIPCRALAIDNRIPPRYLLQILRSLVKAGIMCSVRGAGGGYYITRPLVEISLLDIIDAVEKSPNAEIEGTCDFSEPVRMQLYKTFKLAAAAERSVLGQVTLADLVMYADIKGATTASGDDVELTRRWTVHARPNQSMNSKRKHSQRFAGGE